MLSFALIFETLQDCGHKIQEPAFPATSCNPQLTSQVTKRSGGKAAEKGAEGATQEFGRSSHLVPSKR